MQELMNVITLPSTAAAPKPMSIEEQVAEQLGEEQAIAALAICKKLATEARSIGSIGIEVFGLPDTDEGRNTAKCRFYSWKVRSSALDTLYARARAARADMLVDELVELADAPLPKAADAMVLKAEVERRRLQIDARKWAAGKFNRLLYAEDPRQAAAVQVNITDNRGEGAMAVIMERLARKRAAIEAGRRTVEGEADYHQPAPRE
jgi:hypothetical protein